jgi:transcriptional regulator NrdR family protein
MRCNYCGSNQHTIENCPKTWSGQANRRTMYCSYCGSRSHNINACPKTFEGNANRKWNEKEVEDDFVKDNF